MKASMYFNYPSRSLLRGGQRTLLAIFCVAVGVMAIVAMQLAGYMLQSSLSSNTRDTNGGDISITAQSAPLKASDLYLLCPTQKRRHNHQLYGCHQSNGSLNATTTISVNGPGPVRAAGSPQSFSINAINPNNYPIVSLPTFVTPKNGKIATLLTKNQVIVTQNFLDTSHKKVGNTITVYIKPNRFKPDITC